MNRLQIVVALLLTLSGCSTRHGGEEAAAEAKQTAADGELRVSGEQQEHLGLVVQPARRREIWAALATSGWLATAPGSEVVVKSPVAGFVRLNHMPVPALGQAITKGKTLSTLLVFLGPQELAQLVSAKEETDIAVEQSLVSMKLAEEQLNRLKLAQDAVAGTRINELKEIYGRAQAAYRESQDKLPFLLKEPYDVNALVKPVTVDAPLTGRVVQVHVAPDQFVVQGDPLWTIADWSTLWVRVPVFEADLPRIRRGEPAQVTVPGTQTPVPAAPLDLSVATKPGLRTVDVFYAIKNGDGALREGQSVPIRLAVDETAEEILVPQSALLWDGMGNAWVYVRAGGETFRRRRIETGAAIAEGVVVIRGLNPGEQIVVSGAESLYGEEFKGNIPAADSDG